ncbi:MAG: phosphoribosylformylglycinamidine synthase subunit PurL [Bacteroidota bacterium]
MQATEQEVSIKTAEQLGLNEQEFKRIEEILGRLPNFTELSIFSVMWSEHCSNKSSIAWLRTLPREGKKLLFGNDGENDSLVDIGDGLAFAFKIKQVRPTKSDRLFSGASGPGDVHREIFTKGARPIAALNSLRFGDLDHVETKESLRKVVHDISDYCNRMGVPTVGGEMYFDDSYGQNNLLNSLSAGIVGVGDIIPALAEGPGNSVLIAGQRTEKGEIRLLRDNTEGLDENSLANVQATQINDPFHDKVLMEATLEAIQSGVIVGIQNIGTGGIVRPCSEMSARAGTGLSIQIDRVPIHQKEMKDWEILLSESQSRILIICVRGEEQSLYRIFEKWDLLCTQIGKVTESGLLEIFEHDHKVASIPASLLVKEGGVPIYEPKSVKPRYFSDIRKFNKNRIKSPKNIVEAAKKLFASPNLVSKRWAYEQFDNSIRTNNLTSTDKADAAILRIKGYEKTLALTIDCNASYVYADPYVGGMIAVAEAARNIVCSGGVPVAITHCLNFGNPHDPEIYYQFVNAVKGIGDACRKFEMPVTGGTVNFYGEISNNRRNQLIRPTPVIGMLGIIEKRDFCTTLKFKQEGDLIYMIGNLSNSLGSSEYIREVLNIKYSPVPHFDLYEEFEIQKHIRRLIRKNIVRSAHDVSDGGVFTNLMESAIMGGIGFNVETVATFRKDSFLFGESQGRIVITISPEQEDTLQNYLINNNVSFTKLGEVFGDVAIIDEKNFGYINDWKRIHEDTLWNKLNDQQ